MMAISETVMFVYLIPLGMLGFFSLFTSVVVELPEASQSLRRPKLLAAFRGIMGGGFLQVGKSPLFPRCRWMQRPFYGCVALFAYLVIGGEAVAKDDGSNKLPEEVAHALITPDMAVLYSLDPNVRGANGGEVFYHFKILGRIELNERQVPLVSKAFESALSSWDKVSARCFSPRHALRVMKKGNRYDYLLCYECKHLNIYKNGKFLRNFGVAGSPKDLNDLLAAAGVPLLEVGESAQKKLLPGMRSPENGKRPPVKTD